MSTTAEPLSNGHHWEPKFSPLYRGDPNSGVSGIFFSMRGMRNQAVEYNMAVFFRAFLCCMLAGKACTMSNSANLTAMVDNLAEKVDKYPLNLGR